jgi:hypothetical protein
MAKRIIRELYGIAATIPRCKPGAMAQCAFCEWARFFPDSKRKRRRAIYRAAAALQGHARTKHADKFPKFSTAEEMFGNAAD